MTRARQTVASGGDRDDSRPDRPGTNPGVAHPAGARCPGRQPRAGTGGLRRREGRSHRSGATAPRCPPRAATRRVSSPRPASARPTAARRPRDGRGLQRLDRRTVGQAAGLAPRHAGRRRRGGQGRQRRPTAPARTASSNRSGSRPLSGDDQLRQRVAFALSQIFVISMQDGTVGDNPRAVAAYLDMLADKGFGNYRELLEAVSLHPMMGAYLSHLRNQKADPRTGRVPDENYAREVMQLFSIGLVAAQRRRQRRADRRQAALETYTPADIAGLAKVFTGWSWACPDWPDNSCFFNGSAERQRPTRTAASSRWWATRSTTAPRRRSFLGTTIAAQTHGRPEGQPEDRARHAVQPPERRPLHRQAADPAPGHQQPEPGLRGARSRRPSTTTAAACAAT